MAENNEEQKNEVLSEETVEKKPVKVRRHRVLSHPTLACILLVIYGFFFYQIAGEFGGHNDLMSFLCSALGGILLLVIHRLWFRREYKGCMRSDCFSSKEIMKAVGIFFLADIISWIPGVIRVGFAAPTLFSTGSSLMAGIGEEAVFRVLPISVMMRAYKDRDKYLPALILPAILFGSIHLLNFTVGADLSQTILQVVAAGITGFFLGAVFLRTGSAPLTIAIHFLHDFLCEMLASQSTGLLTAAMTWNDVVENGLVAVVQIILTVWLLRGHKEDILSTWQNIWQNPDA